MNSFLSHLGQVIEHIDETGTLSELRNQEGYDMAGISGEARIRFKDGHALFLNSSWHRVFWGRVQNDEGVSCSIWPWEDQSSACSLITDVPQLRANAGFFFDLQEWGTTSLFGHLGSMRRNNWRSQLEQMRTFEIPAYTVINAVYQTPRIGEGLYFRVLAKNMLQEEIKDPVPRPDADRMPGLLPRAAFEAFAQMIWRN